MWLSSPKAVLFIGTELALCSMALAFHVARHPLPSKEALWSWLNIKH
ncbi:MAG: hypothetical protein V7771_08995 [Shewanella psychromarinicola]